MIEVTKDQPPVIDSLSDQTIGIGEELSFTVTASDPNGDPITYNMSGLDGTGATLNNETGEFSWTPTIDEGGSYTVTFTAIADGKTDSVEITIDVKKFTGKMFFIGADESDQVYVLESNNKTQLTSSTGYKYQLNPSPNGDYVVYEMNGEYFISDMSGNKNSLLTKDDTRRIKWAPDGSELAYITEDNNGTPDDYTDDIFYLYTSDPSGNDTQISDNAYLFDWSPTGDLAFDIVDRNNYEAGIYVNDLGNRLTSTDILASRPIYSPSGDRIAYMETIVDDNGTPSDMSDDTYSYSFWVMDEDGTNKQKLDDSMSYSFVWSPDGSKIAYRVIDYNDDIEKVYVVGTDGSSPEKLAEKSNCEFEALMWSPSGDKLAYKIKEDSSPYLESLHVVDVFTNNSSIIVDDADYVSYSWSPSEDKLVYGYSDSSTGQDVIYRVNGDGSNNQQIAVGHNPVWSPSGEKIAFVSEDSSYKEVYLISPDGSNKVQLTDYQLNYINDLHWIAQ